MKQAKKIVVGNWKTHPDTAPEAKNIAKRIRLSSAVLKRTKVVVCPPFLYMDECKSLAKKSVSALGAQNVLFEEGASYTGEISAQMLKNVGVEYVIVGHSERRHVSCESDTVVAKKASVCARNGLTAVVCVGERERDVDGGYLAILSEQIRVSFQEIDKSLLKNIIVAYEPIWAVGAKYAMKPEDVYESTLFVRKILSELYGKETGFSVPVLYGGAVTPENAAEIISVGLVEGLLVGRESIVPEHFIELLKSIDGL